MPSNQKFDVHQEITNRIISALESVGEYRLPWISDRGDVLQRPVNIASKKPYNGVNIVSLWLSSLAANHPSNLWGTYRQWQASGGQVRKGEKASLVVFYKTVHLVETDPVTGKPDFEERMFARASWVFNAAQIEGFVPENSAIPSSTSFDPLARAEAFASATGAVIEEGGDMAAFHPGHDIIHMPDRRRFIGSRSMSPAESFYSTLCHELVHWSGAKPRLNRDLSTRYGSEAYAMEELVAELGAAFLCSDLGITPEPRPDHACYIKSWLQVLKSDKKAIFTAASKASQAATWLIAKEGAA